MAHSEFEYVRNFELSDVLPPSNWIVVRIDGRGFSKFSKKHAFEKPNDRRALDLMNAAATEVVKSIVDVVLAYGQSDEYSFVLQEKTTLFERRSAKLATTIATAFTAEYCMQWPTFFPNTPLTRPYPTFDGRCICYPKRTILRDYLNWRQADCHINNLYNTTFWKLVLKGDMSAFDAEQALQGSVSSTKNEILFSRFGINYNNEPEIYRKGTMLYRSYDQAGAASGDSVTQHSRPSCKTADPASKTQIDRQRKSKLKATVTMEHCDLISDTFWLAHPHILSSGRGEVEVE